MAADVGHRAASAWVETISDFWVCKTILGLSFDRSNFRGPGRERFRAFQNVQPERVTRGIVQEQGQMIKAHHLLKPTGQVVEESLQIAVEDDRFGDR